MKNCIPMTFNTYLEQWEKEISYIFEVQNTTKWFLPCASLSFIFLSLQPHRPISQLCNRHPCNRQSFLTHSPPPCATLTIKPHSTLANKLMSTQRRRVPLCSKAPELGLNFNYFPFSVLMARMEIFLVLHSLTVKVEHIILSYLWLRARKALILFNDFPLRKRRMFSP